MRERRTVRNSNCKSAKACQGSSLTVTPDLRRDCNNLTIKCSHLLISYLHVSPSPFYLKTGGGGEARERYIHSLLKLPSIYWSTLIIFWILIQTYSLKMNNKRNVQRQENTRTEYSGRKNVLPTTSSWSDVCSSLTAEP